MSTGVAAQIDNSADSRTHDAQLSESTFSGRADRVPELDPDAIGAVLGALVEACDDPEAAARAAATWTVLSRAHRDACYKAEAEWRALLERHFPERVRFVSENTNARLTSYWLCTTVRAYREGRLTLRTACDTHKRVKAFVLAALRHNGNGLCDLPESRLTDRDVILAATEGKYVLHRRDIAERFRDDREVMLGIVRWSGRALEYASRRLRDDREVVITAVRQTGYAHMFASTRLFADWEIVEEARMVGERSRRDREEWLSRNPPPRKRSREE